MSDLSVVVVSYNAWEHLERCLESVVGRGHEVIVVDNGSTDGSPEQVRERFPGVLLLEPGANLGFGAANNLGMRSARGRLILLLNSDAWPIGNSLERLVAEAERYRQAAVIGPRLLNPDGSLQRSLRGFPTLWRLATEYLFLRKLAPGSRLLNAFYGAGFDHGSPRQAEFLLGAVLLVRPEAVAGVGGFDPDFFMFSEETDLCYRLSQSGWTSQFTPAAEFVHVGGGSTGKEWTRMYREQLRGHLRFLAKHRGRRTAARARLLLLVALGLRGLLFRGERGRSYRQAARWLADSSLGELLAPPPAPADGSRVANHKSWRAG